MNINKRLLDSINDRNKNTLILGKAGCGKSELIKSLASMRDDIILTAPSGIAAQNIGGRTIQSFFYIKPNTYSFDNNCLHFAEEKIEMINNSNILLIDEISMIRCEILDIVDQKLKIIRNNPKPFGGMKLLFLGDMCQMEPVVQETEKDKLSKQYPGSNGDYNFYNARAMAENNYFNDTFDIFQIEDDFRHKDDPVFMNILNHVRIGKKTTKLLDMINEKYQNKHFYNMNIQYLTVTRSKAQEINEMFINQRKNEKHYSYAIITELIPGYYCENISSKTQFLLELLMIEGMKIMFIKNDGYKNGMRWVNGTFGKIKKIVYRENLNMIDYVIVEIQGKGDVDVRREKTQISDSVNFGITDNNNLEVIELEQFPFVPSYAITIDKSQGLTLDKIAVVLGRNNRPNQIYVALSRVRSLSDIILLDREMRGSDIVFSKTMSSFLDKIDYRIIRVSNYIHNEQNITINFNINKLIFSSENQILPPGKDLPLQMAFLKNRNGRKPPVI